MKNCSVYENNPIGLRVIFDDDEFIVIHLSKKKQTQIITDERTVTA